jgi:hypothetical protein
LPASRCRSSFLSNVAQVIVGRFGVRPTLTAGLLLSAISVAWLTQLPVDGHYFWDLFPAFVLGGAGMGLSFVPVTIASLTGVERSDAGVASGLINTSRQIGGAIRDRRLERRRRQLDEQLRSRAFRRRNERCGARPRLQTALYALTGLLVIGALIAVTFVRSAPAPSTQAVPVDGELVALDEAA